MQFRYPIVRFLFRTAQSALCPFARLRCTLVKGLILMEEDQEDTQKSLHRLLDVHGFIETVIDRKCIAWGDGIHVKHQIMDGIHSFFTDRIPPGSRVLDVGSGIGALAHSLAVRSQVEVIGMDTSKAHVRFARERFQHPRLRFVVGDVTAEMPGEKIDAVVLSSVLEHLDDRIGFLKKLQNKYQPKTYLIRVPTFERHYHTALKRSLGLFPYTDPDHRLEYTMESFAEEMKAAGMVIRYIEVRWGDIWAECIPSKQ